LGFAEGDYLENPLPSADVTSFGHVFDGRNHQICRELVERAYAAPPPGGASIVYDAMIQPGPLKNRSNNFMTLLSSRNIMMVSREGYESSTAACAQLLRAGGFTRIKVRHLVGPTSAVFGYKPGQLPTTA
jgi:hypothetical protein